MKYNGKRGWAIIKQMTCFVTGCNPPRIYFEPATAPWGLLRLVMANVGRVMRSGMIRRHES